jgi:hypothetical protein
MNLITERDLIDLAVQINTAENLMTLQELTEYREECNQFLDQCWMQDMENQNGMD